MVRLPAAQAPAAAAAACGAVPAPGAGEAIEALEGDNRRLVADLAQVTAGQDGLRIALRLEHAALEEAAWAAAALGRRRLVSELSLRAPE